MRLYGVRPTSQRKPIPELYFNLQLSAKRMRDELTKATGEQHVVTYGPDHHKYKP